MYRRMQQQQLAIVERDGEPMNVFRDPAYNKRIGLPWEGQEDLWGFARKGLMRRTGQAGKYTPVLREMVAKWRGQAIKHSLNTLTETLVSRRRTVMVDIHPMLRNRKSGVAFSAVPLEPEKLEMLLEAFRWGPSSRNAQPWRIVVVRSSEAHQKFDAALSENNAKWATRAPDKMIILGNPEEQPDRNGQNRWLLDVGLALENLLLQGCDLGLTVHALAGWDEDTVLKNFNIPEPFRVAALFAVGYPGKVEDLSEELQQRAKQPQVRKPLAEVVFWEEFGKAGTP